MQVHEEISRWGDGHGRQVPACVPGKARFTMSIGCVCKLLILLGIFYQIKFQEHRQELIQLNDCM